MHDLTKIRQDLRESLSLDKHPVAILFGAGCPCSVRVPDSKGVDGPLIPDIAGLTIAVSTALKTNSAFIALTKQFEEDGAVSYNVEDLLSRVRILNRIVGKGHARGLSKSDLETLEKDMCQQIVAAVRKELPGTDTPYHWLADWIGGVSRTTPVELFTTNYDLLMEQALEDRSLAYFDGFVGGRRPFFDLRAIEDDMIPARWVRLWKLHGCSNWSQQSSGRVIRNCDVSQNGEGLLIHPSELKYDQSRRMPYLAMIDRLRAFMRRPSAFLVTVGYAFADEHLNEVLMQGFRSNPSAAGFVLLYKKLAEERNAAAVATRVPSNLALLARDRGVVRNRNEEFVDPISATPSAAVENALGDFASFARFLKEFARSTGS